jgi:hypothetical protein
MHVLIGTDGSPLSIEATRRAFMLLGETSRVTLLAVFTSSRKRTRRVRRTALPEHSRVR